MKQVLLFCLIIWNFSGVTQAETITPKDVQEATRNLDYRKTKTIREAKASQRDPVQNQDMPEPSFSNGGEFVELVFKWLIYTIIGMVLLLILVYIYNHSTWQSDAKAEDEKTTAVAQVEHSPDDYEKLLQTALQQGDYRMIIRMRYLIVLKTLDERKKIKLETGKTNRSYARELKGSLKEPFTQLVRLFEKSWYGNYEIKEAQLLSSEAWYHQMISDLNE